MRNIQLTFAAVGAIAMVAACGPSGKQVATAKQARYQGDKLQLFAAVKAATESKYKLKQVDETALGLQTVGRWYNAEGQAVSSNVDDLRDVPDQSLNISLIVEVLPEGSNYVVAIKPVILRRFKDRPNADVLDPKDPSIPGWAHGKADNLSVEIYDALKQYEVRAAAPGAPGAPGSGPPAPGAAPVTPPPGDPAAPAPAPADPAAPAPTP